MRGEEEGKWLLVSLGHLSVLLGTGKAGVLVNPWDQIGHFRPKILSPDSGNAE